MRGCRYLPVLLFWVVIGNACTEGATLLGDGRAPNKPPGIRPTLSGIRATPSGDPVTPMVDRSGDAPVTEPSNAAPQSDPAPAFGPEGWSPSSPQVPSYFLQPDSSFRVQQGRPRLYFRKPEIAWLRQRGQGPLADKWKFLQRMAAEGAARSPGGPEAADGKGWNGDKSQAVAFFALLDDNKTYLDWAVAWAKALGAGPPPSDDTAFRGRLQRMAVVYDWLHDKMSAADQATIRAAIIKYVEAMRDWPYIKNPGYIGGHERWGYAVLAMGLIAVHGEYAGADALLLQCREHIAKGLYPTQAWIASDGGYHMGWAYSSAYTTFDLPYLVWTVGTNDVLLGDWMAETSAFYLYGMQGDDTFPPAGDAYSTKLDQAVLSSIYGAGLGKRGLARWFLENKSLPMGSALLQLLLNDPAVLAEAPGASLPLGRLFKQAGLVVARDGWGADATHLTFKSGAFFSVNHHHRDENAFTVHYKGPLAIDSGVYDSYGSTHWKNYYTRTIAHNAITVHDPTQTMVYSGSEVSNDGGQIFASEPKRLVDIQPGGHAALDGIVRFENHDAFTYARGDATKAYDPRRVTLAQREVVYLRKTGRPHPAIVVFDRVGATSGALQKRFLLHTVARPEVNGSLAVASQGGGRLSLLSLYPAGAALTLVGGAGKESFVDGVNYPPSTSEAAAGAWRLEIAPPTGQGVDPMLQVLFVDDVAAAPVAASAAALVSGTAALGVEVAGWTVVFPQAPSGASQLGYAVKSGGTATHLVTGLPPGKVVTFRVDGANQGSVTTGAGGCAMLGLTTGAGAQVTVN